MGRGSIGSHPSAAAPPPLGAGAHSADGTAVDVGGNVSGFTYQLPSPELGIQSAWHTVTGTDIADGNGIEDLEHPASAVHYA